MPIKMRVRSRRLRRFPQIRLQHNRRNQRATDPNQRKMVMAEKDPQTYAIIGAAMEVHRQLGHGFLEAVYQEALTVEFQLRNIPFGREIPMEIHYKDRVLPCTYKADFVCYDSVIVEIKAIEKLGSVEQSQVINYLNATKMKRALLINFGAPGLQYERLVLNL
jgi:GxxExxY protein